MRRRELRRRIAEHPYWWHSIRLGRRLATPGHRPEAALDAELAAMDLPTLRGKTVLDIGAWDGYFSFAAERLGASRVLALDHHTWGTDMTGWTRSAREPWRVAAAGRPAKAWDPEGLPGKRGFDLAREALGSRVEARFADILAVEEAELGQFDVVFLLGVLYHCRHPVEMIERVAALTRETLVIETEAFTAPGLRDASLAEFFEGDELYGDGSNWWSVTEPALAGICRSSGFDSVRLLEPIDVRAPEPSGVIRHRALAQALKPS